MKKLLYLWPLLLGLFTGCAARTARSQEVSTYPGTSTPELLGFDFKGIYDSVEVFQKRNVYYTRVGRNLNSNTGRADTLVKPQKLQGGIHIIVRGPATGPGQPGPLLRSSQGLFFDGRKDNLWLYVKYVQAHVSPNSPIQTLPSLDSTIVEEYDWGKLLSRKRGAPYHGTP